MTDPDTTATPADKIAQLPDDQAISALALVARRHGLELDATTVTIVEDRVREALTQPDLQPVIDHPDATANAGDVARTALAHLTTSDTYRDDVTRALALTRSGERLDPATLAIGALVLFAFHADIELRKEPDSGWHFRFKTTALSESTIGKVLGQLFGAYSGGK